jgi:hypothetical protein
MPIKKTTNQGLEKRYNKLKSEIKLSEERLEDFFSVSSS